MLGYDPENLTEGQRDTIEAALQDPGQNIFIASEYLKTLKEESGFANVPAEEMARTAPGAGRPLQRRTLLAE
ncbi:hypothetical protein ABZ615_11415 [Streptomyces sp. NPDC007325]|uniref:hypothetical protein n=1 Tax=Streptomyces sp. NPDC007325 TaxID=3154588 RepID=UPI0033E0003B